MVRKVTPSIKRVAPGTTEKKQFSGGNKSPVSWEKIKHRINPKPRPARRYKTGIPTLDEWTGGLPYGTTVIYGSAGCGKSLLARTIATKAEHCLYFCSEVFSDAPAHQEYPNVDIIDYTNSTFLPHWRKALDELDMFITKLEPTLVVIDSVTSFLSRTKKAVKEADVPEGLSTIHRNYEGVVPIICISEIRGVGYARSTAGGESVKHNNSMLIEMEHTVVQFDGQVEQYGVERGEDVYTLRVVKDKHNVASNKLARVELDMDDNPKISPAKKLGVKRSPWKQE